jgi:hypothetical protein
MAKFDYDDAQFANLPTSDSSIKWKGSIFCISNSSRDWVCSTL